MVDGAGKARLGTNPILVADSRVRPSGCGKGEGVRVESGGRRRRRSGLTFSMFLSAHCSFCDETL